MGRLYNGSDPVRNRGTRLLRKYVSDIIYFLHIGLLKKGSIFCIRPISMTLTKSMTNGFLADVSTLTFVC